MNGKAIAATLGALASIATIVSLVLQFSHSSGSTPLSESQTSAANLTSPVGSTSPVSPVSPVGPASPTGTTYPSGSSYTASASAIYMNHCEQINSTPGFCQCTMNWFEANVSYSQFVQDMAVEQQYEQYQVANPPDDVVKAYVACGDANA